MAISILFIAAVDEALAMGSAECGLFCLIRTWKTESGRMWDIENTETGECGEWASDEAPLDKMWATYLAIR